MQNDKRSMKYTLHINTAISLRLELHTQPQK